MCVCRCGCVCKYIDVKYNNKIINDISLYYFSNGSRKMKSIPLDLLMPLQPYRIVQVRGNDMVTILHLKDAGKEEFVSCMFRNLIPKFREAVQQNNGEVAGLKLKSYGLSNAGKPIIRISGKRFVKYLV